jgi:aromatic-L-amino-acid decarboxylase
VCFRPSPRAGETPAQTDARAKGLLDAINRGGAAYLTHTVIPFVTPGDASVRTVLRMSIGSTFTQERHVREAWAEIGRRLADS